MYWFVRSFVYWFVYCYVYCLFIDFFSFCGSSIRYGGLVFLVVNSFVWDFNKGGFGRVGFDGMFFGFRSSEWMIFI